MGGKPIPDYANIFMAKLDKQIMQVTDGLFPDENKISSSSDSLMTYFSFSEETVKNYICGLMSSTQFIAV